MLFAGFASSNYYNLKDHTDDNLKVSPSTPIESLVLIVSGLQAASLWSFRDPDCDPLTKIFDPCVIRAVIHSPRCVILSWSRLWSTHYELSSFCDPDCDPLTKMCHSFVIHSPRCVILSWSRLWYTHPELCVRGLVWLDWIYTAVKMKYKPLVTAHLFLLCINIK